MTPKYDERGLIPAVAQDARSGRILMLAWMNAQALELTTATGRATYWSRSRQALWVKGESSGHTQEVVDLRLDCDLDAVLMLVNQTGPACHTGETSCFFYDAEGTPCDPPSSGMIERLEEEAGAGDRKDVQASTRPVTGQHERGGVSGRCFEVLFYSMKESC